MTLADALREIERLTFRNRMLLNQLRRARPLTRPRNHHCLYCGHACKGLTCPAHHDLLRIDPPRHH